MEAYDKEAMKTMQDYQARKNEVSMTFLYLIYSYIGKDNLRQTHFR